jgi:hypothetical protein
MEEGTAGSGVRHAKRRERQNALVYWILRNESEQWQEKRWAIGRETASSALRKKQGTRLIRAAKVPTVEWRKSPCRFSRKEPRRRTNGEGEGQRTKERKKKEKKKKKKRKKKKKKEKW